MIVASFCYSFTTKIFGSNIGDTFTWISRRMWSVLSHHPIFTPIMLFFASATIGPQLRGNGVDSETVLESPWARLFRNARAFCDETQ